MRRTVMLGCLTLLLWSTLPAADWPQWRGPKRDGVSAETGVKAGLTTKGGPKLAWTFRDTGRGNACPTVVGENIYVMGDRKGTEYVIALDLKGKELWAAPVGPTWEEKNTTPYAYTVGPNCGPAVEGKHLYALSSSGFLICVDVTSGKEVWKSDLVKSMQAVVTDSGGGEPVYGYGFSWSPLIDGDRLIITPGGKGGLFAALDRMTGKELWRSKEITDDATYASPIVAEIHGVRQYITATQFGPVAVDAKTGKQLWYPRRAEPIGDMVCPTPIVVGDKVVFTSTKAGMTVYQISKEGDTFTAKPAYPVVRLMSNFHGGVVLLDGHVFGAHDSRDWKCINLATGKIAWSSQEFDRGSILAVDGVLVLLAQSEGEVGVISPDPAAYTELNRWKLPEESKMRKPSGRLWTPPVVAAGKLFVRDQELLFCYDLK